MNLKNCSELMRVRQYYKNLPVFLAPFFAGRILEVAVLVNSIIGFAILCIASSSFYIFNDLMDIKKDKSHPEKSRRPLAAGFISTEFAAALSAILGIAALVLSYRINSDFFYVILALIALSLAYSIAASRIIFLDIIFISINFVLRSISGGAMNGIWVSPWLVSGSFFLAFFLSAGKRESEIIYLRSVKKIRAIYTEKLLTTLLYFSGFMLAISYMLYAITTNIWLVATVPSALYMAYIYLKYASIGTKSARNHEFLFLDKKMMVNFSIYLMLLAFIVYWKRITFLF